MADPPPVASKRSYEGQRPSIKKSRPDPYQSAYHGLRYERLPADDQPGTPSRYFPHSFRVHFEDGGTQIVHQHVNGLVVVTAGNGLSDIVSLQWMAEEEPGDLSQGAKRKLLAKLLRGQAVAGTVQPRDILAVAKTAKGDVTLRCGVWGLVTERNHDVQPTTMVDDPLLDGYLAVLLPAGPFPPRTCLQQDNKEG